MTPFCWIQKMKSGGVMKEQQSSQMEDFGVDRWVNTALDFNTEHRCLFPLTNSQCCFFL